MQVLTTKEKKEIQSRSIEKKAFSYIRLKNLVKEYNKIIKLLQPEMIDHLKETGFFVFKVKEGKETFEGSIDLLTKKTSRFDVKAFKEKYPDLYETYLVSGESHEIRGNVVKTIPYGQRKYGVK